jgi:hypothetical protein
MLRLSKFLFDLTERLAGYAVQIEQPVDSIDQVIVGAALPSLILHLQIENGAQEF